MLLAKIDGSAFRSTPLADNSPPLAHTGRGLKKCPVQDVRILRAPHPNIPSPSPHCASPVIAVNMHVRHTE